VTVSTISSEPVLEARSLSKSFGSTKALQDVSIDLRAGEVLCLVGENGAGKSTLGKIVAGFQSADEGEIVIGGEVHQHLTPAQAIGLGIAIVSQEIDVIGSVSVAENVFLGNEVSRRGILSWAQMHRETAALAESLGVSLLPEQIVDDLSTAQKQIVQILRAMHRQARVVVFDEPTSSLGAQEKALLMALIERLRSDGVAIIYVTHFLEEVFAIGDRAVVLKDGRHVVTTALTDLTIEDIVRMMVGRDESSFFTRERRGPTSDKGLEIIDYSGNGVDGVTLSLLPGEVLGLGGLIGAGRSELADLVFGAAKRTSGRLMLDGRDITPRSPRDAIANGICMLTEDRQSTGLLRARSIRENIAIARSEFLGPFLQGETPLVNEQIGTLHVVAHGPEQGVDTLSGGNQQKVLLGRWLAVPNARVLILDEPTKGVDIGAKHEIYGHISRLANEGAMILLISSDLPELLSLSDRIAVMRGGRVTVVRDASEVSEESLMREFVGVANAA